MADLKEYQLVTDGKTLTDSKGFSGKGVATYPNGDTFEGEWVDGLR